MAAMPPAVATECLRKDRRLRTFMDGFNLILIRIVVEPYFIGQEKAAQVPGKRVDAVVELGRLGAFNYVALQP